MEKGIKYNQDHPSIVLLFEHNFRHNAVVLRVTLNSIKYLTLFAAQTFNGGYKRKKKAPVEGLCSKLKYRANTIHHFIFGFFRYFFYHSSCHKDQFTVLSLKFGIEDFTDPGQEPRSTKDPAEPQWFVVVGFAFTGAFDIM